MKTDTKNVKHQPINYYFEGCFEGSNLNVMLYDFMMSFQAFKGAVGVGGVEFSGHFD